MGAPVRPGKPAKPQQRSQTRRANPAKREAAPTVPAPTDFRIPNLQFADKVTSVTQTKKYRKADKVTLNYNTEHSCWVAAVTFKEGGNRLQTNMSSDNYYICEKGKRGTKDHYLKFWWKHQDSNRGWFCKRSPNDRYLRVAGGGLSDFYRLIGCLAMRFDWKDE